jgi:hypothetical protein
VADHRAPRELHELFWPRERTSLADAARKNHSDSTRCHFRIAPVPRLQRMT